MTNTITRAAQNHNIIAVLEGRKIISKPKPEKAKKVKCVPVAKRRKKLEKQIEDIIKLIIFWRDGQVCVMGQIDGARCGNGLMWSHVIAQKQSSWLKIDLGNVVCGCGNHNLLDFRGDKTLTLWYCQAIGVRALEMLQNTARLYSGIKRTEWELEQLLAHYDNLYQNRFTVDLDLQSLIKAGYYGEVVRLALA